MALWERNSRAQPLTGVCSSTELIQTCWVSCLLSYPNREEVSLQGYLDLPLLSHCLDKECFLIALPLGVTIQQSWSHWILNRSGICPMMSLKEVACPRLTFYPFTQTAMKMWWPRTSFNQWMRTTPRGWRNNQTERTWVASMADGTELPTALDNLEAQTYRKVK